jgi:hypothetical protein
MIHEKAICKVKVTITDRREATENESSNHTKRPKKAADILKCLKPGKT